MSDEVAVMTDGDAGLRLLLMPALPKARHILDWYLPTRCLTVLQWVLHGKETINQFPSCYHERLRRHPQSLKWRLWHGFVGSAFNRIKALLLTLRLSMMTGKRAAGRTRRVSRGQTRHSDFANGPASLANAVAGVDCQGRP